MRRLLIASRDLAVVEERALAAFPEECCGLLLGRADGGGAVRVEAVEACVNRAADRRRRFTISAEALLASYRRARREGGRLVGTYHSHPRGAAVPSESDHESAWPGASFLIVGLGDRGLEARRSWRLERDRFVEEELVIGEPAGGAVP